MDRATIRTHIEHCVTVSKNPGIFPDFSILGIDTELIVAYN